MKDKKVTKNATDQVANNILKNLELEKHENIKTLNLLCSVIEKLEEKQANGTITFEESATLFRLIEQTEYILSI